MSSPLGLTDCGSEDGHPALPEQFPFPEQEQYLYAPYPYLLPVESGDLLCDDSEFSALMESMSDEPGSYDEGAGPISAPAFDPYSDLGGYPDLELQAPGYPTTLGPADYSAFVTANPGPANFSDGVPVLDS